jgi:N-acetyl-anhydromuramyl-L-alanine amidase AmpD
MSDLPKIDTFDFPKTQYYQEEFKKEIIVLHHTASGRGAEGDYGSWINTPERVATSHIINRDGSCCQLYNSKYWAHHIGCTHPNNRRLNQISIGIEIDSWGILTWRDGKFYTYTNSVVPEKDVVEYEKSFRGGRFFERYTPEQVESTRKLLLYWNKVYGIPLDYHEDMWDLSNKAFMCTPGIWAHVSFVKAKSDVHPQPELIEMLKNLKK